MFDFKYSASPKEKLMLMLEEYFNDIEIIFITENQFLKIQFYIFLYFYIIFITLQLMSLKEAKILPM